MLQDWNLLCQRPKRAFFISTRNYDVHIVVWTSCVNALNGLSSFLPLLMKTEQDNGFVCQRPKRAFFISTKIKGG